MGLRSDKIEGIQLLRALAASIVAFTHLAFGFANHIGPGLGLARASGHASQVAVALFFIVSGFIMVIASEDLFGTSGASRTFWTKRCVRIFPAYWLASSLLAVIFVILHIPFKINEFFLSLLLIPYPNDQFIGRPIFFLWPGWTLFYEIIFYVLFGIGISRGRNISIVSTFIFILLIILLGVFSTNQSVFISSLTQPVLLMFTLGMTLALVKSLRELPILWRFIALAGAVMAYAYVPAPPASPALGFEYVVWAGLPALLFSIAVLGGPLRFRCFGAIDQLGNISYSAYLLHVPLAHAWINIFPLRLGAWPFLISSIALLYGVSLLNFRYFEQPTMLWLNRLLLGRLSRRPASAI